MYRFLHPGQSTIATFVAPMTWGSVPALFFKRNISSEEDPSPLPLTLLGTGTSMAPSSSRVIAKRIILTGHPYKIHKKLVTIRYMFFNREDVECFKATFDGKINPQDSVGVSLYKRMWPRNARVWKPEELVAGEGDVAMEVDTVV